MPVRAAVIRRNNELWQFSVPRNRNITYKHLISTEEADHRFKKLEKKIEFLEKALLEIENKNAEND